jgi:hypothetical protein
VRRVHHGAGAVAGGGARADGAGGRGGVRQLLLLLNGLADVVSMRALVPLVLEIVVAHEDTQCFAFVAHFKAAAPLVRISLAKLRQSFWSFTHEPCAGIDALGPVLRHMTTDIVSRLAPARDCLLFLAQCAAASPAAREIAPGRPA